MGQGQARDMWACLDDDARAGQGKRHGRPGWMEPGAKDGYRAPYSDSSDAAAPSLSEWKVDSGTGGAS